MNIEKRFIVNINRQAYCSIFKLESMYRFLSILSILVIISTVPLVSAEVIRGESTVPDWIKNTAGWWASEQIPDTALLEGMQYMI